MVSRSVLSGAPIVAIMALGLLAASISYTFNSAVSQQADNSNQAPPVLSLLNKVILPPAFSTSNLDTSLSTLVPGITITSPISGSILNNPRLTVIGTTTASGGSAITKVTIKLNNGPTQNATPVSPGNWSSWVYNIDMTHHRVGQYKIVANATNAAGISNWAIIRIAYSLYDNFGSAYTLSPSSYSPDKKWFGVWNGGGSFGTHVVNGTSAFYEESQPAIAESRTNSALAITAQTFKNFVLSVDVTTNKQLRQNQSPNPWEVAWIIWHWKDNTHFKYFLVKQDGSETGKYDGGVNPIDQKILMTSRYPTAVIAQTMHWKIIVKGNHTTVYVDGAKVFDLFNSSSYYYGKVGLYSEDSSVSFSNLNILPTS